MAPTPGYPRGEATAANDCLAARMDAGAQSTFQAVPMLSQPRPANTLAWVRHDDTCGFSLEMPSTWRVKAKPVVGRQGELEVSDPEGTAAAMLRVRQVPMDDSDLAQWLRQSYPATEAGLHNVAMLRVHNHGPQMASAAFDYGSQVFSGRAHVVAIRQGTIVLLLVAAAARAEFSQRLPALVRILNSLRFELMRTAHARPGHQVKCPADAALARDGEANSEAIGPIDLEHLLMFDPTHAEAAMLKR